MPAGTLIDDMARPAPATFPGTALLDEAARLAVLRRYSVPDKPGGMFFDRLTELTAKLFQAPMATITFIDETRQWFTWRTGLPLAEAAREITFCQHAIRRREVMVVPDALHDDRFAGSPLVTAEPRIRFYAGAPLVTVEGAAIGTLAVMDTRPRRGLARRERQLLASLADLAVREIETRGDGDRLRRGAEEIFRLALQRLPLGLFALNAELVYTWAFNTVCGWPAATLEGRRNAEVFKAEDAALLDRMAADVLATGSGVHAHIRCREPDSGALLYVDYRLEPLPAASGRPPGVVGVAIDVTDETRLMREAALARAKIEAAARSKSHFFAAASHDLRQPFQAMRLFADVLAQRLTDPRDQIVLQRLNEAMKAGEGLLNALLEISVLEAGTLKPDFAVVPVHALTLQLAQEFKVLALDKGLDLRHCVPRVDIRTDPAMLHRMLRHLLANAVRYSDRGKILLGGRVRGDTLMLQIWDTGMGIPGKELRAIFEPFYQLGNPERDRTRGLGLGLAIVEKTARLLGHSLGVRSRPGRGSVFTIGVPLVRKR